jgi:hypothetical protein
VARPRNGRPIADVRAQSDERRSQADCPIERDRIWSMVMMAAVGDVRIFRTNPESMLKGVRDIFKNADIAFCQSESVYSDKGSMGSSGPRGASPRDLGGYPAFASAGFDVVSMASNHTMDWGRDALIDSISRIRRDGIQTIGAGENIAEARRPAIVERDGMRVAFVGYCSVAPKGYYAVSGRAGVAPMRAITHYEPLEEDQPGTPCRIMTWPLQRDLDALVEDVRQAKRRADVVAVSFHWGVHHVPVLIADYQPVVAHAAIDAGADIVLGHHPHILKGIEFYKGGLIFYSLGNFAMDSNPEDVAQAIQDNPWRQEVKAAYRVYGTPGPGDYRKHREANYSLIAMFDLDRATVRRASFLPVMINKRRAPHAVSPSSRDGQRIVEYVDRVTREAGVNAKFRVDGETVVIES